MDFSQMNALVRTSESRLAMLTAPTFYRVALVLGTVVAVWLVYLPTTKSLISQWNESEAGYLILAICCVLLLRQRSATAVAPVRPNALAAGALFLAGTLWLIAYRAGLQVVHEMLLPVLSAGAVYVLFGWPVTRRCLLPIGYVYFAVPVWSLINPALQWGTVVAARVMLRLAGVPAYFNGDIVEIPSGAFEIEEGCSGLNFLVTALALAVLLGELQGRSPRGRMALAALAAGVAVIGNWVRVFTVIVAGHLTQMQHYLVRVEHRNFGMVVFAIAMLTFFVLARRLFVQPAEQPMPAASAGTAVPSGRAMVVAPLLVLIALSAPVAWGGLRSAVAPSASSAASLPGDPGTWSGPAPSGADWRPVFERADHVAQGRYVLADREVELFTAAYLSQQQGKEFGGYANTFLGALQPHGSVRKRTVAGWPFAELEVTDTAGRRWLLWYGYAIDERWFSDATASQLWYGVRSLFGAPLSRVLAVRTACTPDCASGRRVLMEFAGAAFPVLSNSVPGAR